MKKAQLSVAEIIDRAKEKEGRSQIWIVNKMNEIEGISITEVQFSRKKKGNESFTPEEKAALNLIIGTDFK